MIVLTDYFKKKELSGVAKYFSPADLLRACKKIRTSGVDLGSFGYSGCRIMKVRVSGRAVGRMVIFVQVEKEVYIPIAIRLKGDKVFGENLSLSNKKARLLIVKNIGKCLDDLVNGNYEEINF
jgi:hypothetical protein